MVGKGIEDKGGMEYGVWRVMVERIKDQRVDVLFMSIS